MDQVTENENSAITTQKDFVLQECDITGLNKVDVLMALFEAALPNPKWPTQVKISRAYCFQALTAMQGSITYLGGRHLKVNLNGNRFITTFYNEINGTDAAEKVIAKLRKSIQ